MSVKITLLFLLFITFASCLERDTEKELNTWIDENSIPIKSVQAGSSFEDLKVLNEIVGDARIVSLGEPTHGNREVFQLKHRMIEYLVEEMDFNIFALECPFGEAFDINQYVLEGIGTPEEALAGIYYWIWDTQEVVDLLKWIRNYNANIDHKRKIKFYGFDTQDPERAARVMFEYLAKVDPALERSIRPELGSLEISFSNPEIIGRRQWLPEESDSLSLQSIRQVMNSFDRNKAKYVRESSTSDWSFARQHARQVEIWIESYFDEFGEYLGNRDLGQAQNLKWILEQEPSDARMIVWAHNTHVSNSSDEGYELMGLHMKEWYREDIKIFGFFFNQGSFTAIDAGKPSKGVNAFSVGPAPNETLEYHMAKTQNHLAILDLSKLPDKGVVHEWFFQKQPTRNSGGGYNESNPQRYFWPYKLAEAFDAIVYLDSTSPVEYVNSPDFDNMWLVNPRLDSPTNTDFELNSAGETPDGWVSWSKFKRFGVNMTTTDEYAYSGKQSSLLQRTKGPIFGEITPSIRQYIDAAPYRGKRIRLKVAARSDLTESSLAFIRLSIEPDPLNDAHDGLPPFFDSIDKHRIESKEWEIYEIEADVNEDAGIIHYGVYLRDFGSVWMDALQIEIVE